MISHEVMVYPPYTTMLLEADKFPTMLSETDEFSYYVTECRRVPYCFCVPSGHQMLVKLG